MQSFSDLNNYSNTSVNYNTESSYVTSFGPSDGNVAITKYEGEKFLLNKQISLLTATNITRDILINITSSDLDAIDYVQYQGADSTISVAFDGIDTWTVLGIRTVAQYNDVFANLYVGITSSYINTFVLTVEINNQMNDPTQSFTITVTTILSTMFSVPASFSFNEDTLTSVGNISITETFAHPTNYTISIVPEDTSKAKIAFAPGNVEVNSWTTTDTKANINLQLANLVFAPGADFSSNTYFDTNVIRSYDSRNSTKRTDALIAVTYPDYTAPTGYSWYSNATTQIGTSSLGNLAITDTAANKNYSSTISISPTGMGNLYNSNVSVGNTITFTGNISVVNANIANVTFRGNVSANLSGNVHYVQVQTTNSLNQANIYIPLNFQYPSIHIYSNVAKPFGTRLNSDGSYTGGNATGNVDFWAYEYTTNTSYSGGQTYYSYNAPSSANVSLSTFADSTNYRYNDPGIRIANSYGIVSRTESRSNGGAGYIGFWMKTLKNHQYAVYGTIQDTTNIFLTEPLRFGSWNNKMYVWQSEYLYDTNWTDGTHTFAGWDARIILGDNPTVGTWNHYAFQISAGTTGSSGTQVISAWVNGVPITEFYGRCYYGLPTGLLQTGSNSTLKSFGFQNILGFKFGAPNPPPKRTGLAVQGFNDSIGNPRLDVVFDDLVVRQDNPYTNLTSFTPVPMAWGGNVTQLVTGI